MKIHRLFVGNVPAGTSEIDLKQEFSNYGSVKAIDLKSKLNALNNSVDTFAFINIELDDQTLWQCINEFRNEKYKGVYLNVSKAKESFLDRLKREREEAEAAKQKSDVLNPYKKAQEPEPVKKIVEALPVLPTIAKPVQSSSSESSSEEEDETPAPPPPRRPVVASKKDNDEDQLVKKWNQETFIEHGKLKIVSITGQVKEVIDKSKPRNQQSSKDLDEKAKLADEKRKQGLTKLQSAYEQQKLAIQAALTGSGDAKRKKIVFEDDDDGFGSKKQKLTLFDEEDGEDGFKANFTVRKQLAENTERGQQLYDMQTQYHGDSRFKLDERFLGDDTAAGRKKKAMLGAEKSSLDKNGTRGSNLERTKQFEILSKVTGKDIYEREQKEIGGLKGMQRFDPSVKKEAPKQEKIPTEKEILEAKRAERPEEVYQVTEEKFHKVSDGLSQAIGPKSEGFSLLSMFSSVKEEIVEEEEDQWQLQEKPMVSKARFRYESSASEDEDEKPMIDMKLAIEEEEVSKKKKKKGGYLSKQGIWKENFFFLPNDARLEEGRKFFMEFASSAAEANANVKDEQAKDIRKIFKKRRMRETKLVNQIRARRGLKLMKGKRK